MTRKSSKSRRSSAGRVFAGRLHEDIWPESRHGASREQLVHCVEKKKQRHEIENAPFRPCGAAGDPSGPRKRCVRKMAGENFAAVRNGIQKGLAKIETGVHAHGEPQASG